MTNPFSNFFDVLDPTNLTLPFNGVMITPFGQIMTMSAKDKIEHKMLEQHTQESTKNFIKTSSKITQGIKSIENEMSGVLKSKEPQGISGAGATSNIFRIKKKSGKGWTSKYA